MNGPFIDQVLSGFDLNLPDYGVGAFLQKRRPLLESQARGPYVLEFFEVSIDTYEALPAHVPGHLNDTHRNILLWKSAREPYSLQYWSQSEFARLVRLLREGGVDYVMLRTFLTFEGKIGHGRFLRQENSPHADKFEWRRGDEFCRRHPEFRDANSKVIRWNEPLREDPLYRIEAGDTAGRWWARQLVSYCWALGVNAIRLGDDTFSSRNEPNATLGEAVVVQAHEDLKAASLTQGIRLLSSLGPYWSFDAWDHEQEATLKHCEHLADWVLVQPLENWTDLYGFTHVHNGEYFNAGASNIHLLVNAASAPRANFVRGLDSGDMIENWQPSEALPLRESVDASTLFSWVDARWQPASCGLYHFWSDELSPTYYEQQARWLAFLDQHPVSRLAGAVLAVDETKKPHNYVLGDFFEHATYPLRASCPLTDWESLPPTMPIVLFLPRTPGSPAFLDETCMREDEHAALKALLASERELLLVGGTSDVELLEAFGLESVEACAEEPGAFRCGEERLPWFDHASLSAHETMAGRAEKYPRWEYLKLRATTAIEHAACECGRTLASTARSEQGAARHFLGPLPVTAARRVAGQFWGGQHCSEASAALSRASWQDASGARVELILRTDAWSDEEIVLSPSAGKLAFASNGRVDADGRAVIGPQGVLAFVS